MMRPPSGTLALRPCIARPAWTGRAPSVGWCRAGSARLGARAPAGRPAGRAATAAEERKADRPSSHTLKPQPESTRRATTLEGPMPLARIDLRRGKPAAYRTALRDGIYEALRETFDV